MERLLCSRCVWLRFVEIVSFYPAGFDDRVRDLDCTAPAIASNTQGAMGRLKNLVMPYKSVGYVAMSFQVQGRSARSARPSAVG